MKTNFITIENIILQIIIKYDSDLISIVIIFYSTCLYLF